MENIGTEQIYKYLKAQKNEEKILSEKIISNIKEHKINNDNINTIKKSNNFPEQSSKWLYNSFTTYINDNYFECPIISEDEKWLQNEQNKKSPIEIRNLIFQLKDEINYEKFNNIIKANIILKGESKFWIFLHCEKNISDKTVVIVLSKQEFCKRCFVSLGAFIDKDLNNNKKKNTNNNNNINLNNIQRKILYESNTDASKIMSVSSNNGYQNIDNNIDINNNIYFDNNIDNIDNIDNNEENKEYEFVIFKSQELVEEISIKDKKEKNINNDNKMLNDIDLNVCFLNINIFDDGKNIIVKTKLNRGNYENEIKENSFKPIFDISCINNIDNSYKFPTFKIMFAGSGEGCKIDYFYNVINNKDKKYFRKPNDCQCCIII